MRISTLQEHTWFSFRDKTEVLHILLTSRMTRAPSQRQDSLLTKAYFRHHSSLKRNDSRESLQCTPLATFFEVH